MKPLLQVNLAKLPSGYGHPYVRFMREVFMIVETTDANEPAFKLIGEPGPDRRERIASQILGSVLTNPNAVLDSPKLAEFAAHLADALIKELDK